jgi:flagellar motor switch protein FliM
MSTGVEAKPAPAVRKYELGQPFVRHGQRLAFEAIHRAVAQTWSDAMTRQLPSAAAIELESVEFANFSSVSLDQSSCAQLAMFAIESTPISGFLMMSGALAKFVVSGRLGLKAALSGKTAAPFTRIEASVARETMRGLLMRLGEAYLAANLGKVHNLRYCESGADTFLFAPEEPLALLTFRIDGAGADSRILLGLSSSILGSMTDHEPPAIAQCDGRESVAGAVRRLPIEIDVVLGSWTVPLRELLQLRVGEKIVLPDGEDAWLSARGVRLRRANIEISGNQASLKIQGRTASR